MKNKDLLRFKEGDSVCVYNEKTRKNDNATVISICGGGHSYIIKTEDQDKAFQYLECDVYKDQKECLEHQKLMSRLKFN